MRRPAAAPVGDRTGAYRSPRKRARWRRYAPGMATGPLLPYDAEHAIFESCRNEPRFMHIHARSLTYFDTIRRSGSIREAARRLHVASSAINRHLLKLEEEIGAQLFDRLPGGLKLTAAGEIFARHVITVLQDEQRVVSELDGLRGIRQGEIKVLTIEGLNSDFLPAILERMLKRYPALRVQTRTAGSAVIAQAVVNGDTDIGLAFALARTKDLQQVDGTPEDNAQKRKFAK